MIDRRSYEGMKRDVLVSREREEGLILALGRCRPINPFYYTSRMQMCPHKYVLF